MDIFRLLKDPRLNIPSNLTKQDQIKKNFSSYLDLLVKWNKKINLTSEKTAEEILKNHIFDSLQFSRAVFPNSRIIDIGSGAGFPGIPIKIIHPDLNITLVESQRKRSSFLGTVIYQLNLKDIIVINERAEKVIPAPIGDMVILRAVADIKTCIKLASPFLGIGGKVVLKRHPKEKTSQTFEGFLLKQEGEVFGYNDKPSNLMIFEKCFM